MKKTLKEENFYLPFWDVSKSFGEEKDNPVEIKEMEGWLDELLSMDKKEI